MIKTESKKVEEFKDFITSIICDRCQDDLGDELYNIKGAYFIPSSTWCSWMDGTEYERTQIVLCDVCWTEFFDNFIFDHLKHSPKTEKE